MTPTKKMIDEAIAILKAELESPEIARAVHFPYADDGKNCPECDIPLTPNHAQDEAYCLNCNFIIYDVSERND